MKSGIARILKIALLAFLAILVVLCVVGLVLWLDWPWWMALFLLVIVAGIGVAVLFLMKVLSRRREQRFVAQVVEQDEARI